jgi:asparagine synthase (glutamine-hydrolysing)
MCGVAGFWAPQREIADGRSALIAMSDAIRHRGPDADGHWWDEAAGIFLGHRRLSILDLSAAGSQPMTSASRRYVISFNGEIYNFQDLREELAGLGARFRGQSDTEVLLAAVDQWGLLGALKKSAGMFAYGLWDRQERKLALVRDRLGEKPLYYGWMGHTLLFGSELKALRKHPHWRGDIDRDAVAAFLRHNYIPTPYSIYTDVRKVRPGTAVIVSADRTVREVAYWSMAEAAECGTADPLAMDDAEASTALEMTLRGVIRQQMISDVPVGAFLSGGIDSSLVVSLMQAESTRRIKTFTIKFDEAGYDESAHARAVADHLGTEHTELRVTPAEAQDAIASMPAIYDEPFSDSSQIPTFLVSRLVRDHVTVSLSGDGGDEFFGGYSRYPLALRLWKALSFGPPAIRRGVARSIQTIPVEWWDLVLTHAARLGAGGLGSGDRVHKLAALVGARSLEGVYCGFMSHWSRPEELAINAREHATALTRQTEWPRLTEPLHRLMYLDAITYLPDDILVKVDRAAMAVSLETRAPLIDHRVVEFAWRVPAAMNYRAGTGKRLLRRLLDRHVPPAITARPKMGFGIPVGEWLRGPLRGWGEALLSEKRLADHGFLSSRIVRQRWQEHQSGRRSWHYQLWDILMFQAWLEQQ